MTPKLYTTAEVAKIQKIKTITVRLRLKRNQKKYYPNAFKQGRDWVIPAIDLQITQKDL